MPLQDMLCARSPVSDPLGKCTKPMETAVPETVKEDASVYWHLLGYGSEAEFLRDLVMKELYGSFGRVKSVAQRALKGHPGNPREITGEG